MARMKPFHFWCQKVLPLVYDESLSYYEVLCKVVAYLNAMIKDLNSFVDKLDELEIRVDNLEQAMKDIQDMLDDIASGKYIDLYLDSIKCWIDSHIKELVAGIVKYVSFGISADGYFEAYIPDTWDFLGFDTVPYGEPLEGHLVLKW